MENIIQKLYEAYLEDAGLEREELVPENQNAWLRSAFLAGIESSKLLSMRVSSDENLSEAQKLEKLIQIDDAIQEFGGSKGEFSV